LNDPEPGPSRALTAIQPQHIVDHVYTSTFLETIVDQTSGCSVEQLEQIYSALMSDIWRTRGEWDRSKVAVEMSTIFTDVMEDIHVCQGIGVGSMEIEQ
jgi:peptide deformylase